MSVYINQAQMLPAPELIAVMTGAAVPIGTLLYAPVKVILDNQSTSPTVISINVGGSGGLVSWKTFTAGEVVILDDDLYTFPVGTIFYGTGAATGSFSIAYTYINYPGYP